MSSENHGLIAIYFDEETPFGQSGNLIEAVTGKLSTKRREIFCTRSPADFDRSVGQQSIAEFGAGKVAAVLERQAKMQTKLAGFLEAPDNMLVHELLALV